MEYNIDALRERIHASDEITDDDAEALIDFSNELRLLNSVYTDARHDKLLRHCIRMAENVGGLARALKEKEAAEEIVRWIHREYDGSTNQDYRVALRVFGRRATDDAGDDPPESIDWIPSSNSEQTSDPNPSDMVRWEEVKKMAEKTRSSRDAAMVTVAFDLGARSSEFRALTIGDVMDEKDGTYISIDGAKDTGRRKVTLVPSVPYLNKWLADHPARNDPDAPLWTKLNTAEKPSYQMFRKVFKKAGRRADVSDSLTLTDMRKSRASDLASRGMKQTHLEDRMGWVRGSDAAARYISLFNDDAEREFKRIEGVDIPEEDEPDPTAPLNCPRCDRETPRSKDACVWCGQVLSPEAAREIDEAEEAMFDSVANADEDLVDDLRTVREVMNKPEVRAMLADDS